MYKFIYFILALTLHLNLFSHDMPDVDNFSGDVDFLNALHDHNEKSFKIRDDGHKGKIISKELDVYPYHQHKAITLSHQIFFAIDSKPNSRNDLKIINEFAERYSLGSENINIEAYSAGWNKYYDLKDLVKEIHNGTIMGMVYLGFKNENKDQPFKCYVIMYAGIKKCAMLVKEGVAAFGNSYPVNFKEEDISEFWEGDILEFNSPELWIAKADGMLQIYLSSDGYEGPTLYAEERLKIEDMLYYVK